MIRDRPQISDSLGFRIISYVSIFTPFLYNNESELNFQSMIPASILIALFIIGECLSIVGIITLGKSFGVSPAKRTLIDYGIYRLIKHPIYLGYGVTELSILLIYPSKFNLACFLISMGLYVIRATRENFLLKSSP